MGYIRALLMASMLLAAATPRCAAQEADEAAALLQARANSNQTSCKGDWLTAVQHATDGTLGHVPQLSEGQIGAVMAMAKAMQYQLRRPTNLLVFGLGYDSVGWHAANCEGKTVFLENYPPWMELVTSKHPHLEVYQVDYNWDISQAETFFQQPQLIDLPEAVRNTCWDTILVDSPMGYKPTGQPGRMESSYAALQLARQCLDSGASESVVIWLHDVERHVERRIMDVFFAESETVHRFGKLEGDRGTIAGFLLTREPLPATADDNVINMLAAATAAGTNVPGLMSASGSSTSSDEGTIFSKDAGQGSGEGTVVVSQDELNSMEVKLLLIGLLFGFVGGRISSHWWQKKQAGRVLVLRNY